MISITSIDVHPPGYYLLLKFVVDALAMLNLNIDSVILLTIVSIIPSVIILVISLTKIRNEYGYLTGGGYLHFPS